MRLSTEAKKAIVTTLTFTAIILASVGILNINNKPPFAGFKIGEISGTSTVLIPADSNGGSIKVAPAIAEAFKRYSQAGVESLDFPQYDFNIMRDGRIWESLVVTPGGMLVEYDYLCSTKDPWTVDKGCSLYVKMSNGLTTTVRVSRFKFDNPALGFLPPKEEVYIQMAASEAVWSLVEKAREKGKKG